MIEATTHEELKDWIASVIEKEGTRLELRQKGDGAESRVREWKLPDAESGTLAREIQEHADRDGRHLRGPVLYVLLAYREEGAYFARIFVSARGKDVGDRVLETESPTVEGVTSQLMRHTEASARIAVGQTSAIILQYQKMLESAYARIAQLEARQSKVMELYESLTGMEHERQLETMRVRASDKRTEFFKEKLDLIAPVLVNKVLAAKGGPSPSIFGEEMVRQLLKSLKPGQIEHIMGSLEPAQVAILSELYAGYGTRELERDAKANGHQNGVSNGKGG